MQARKVGEKHYRVTSRTDETVEYDVSLEFMSCSCPHFKHRLSKTGGQCHHLEAAVAAENDPANAWARAAEKARKLTNSELDAFLVKYQGLDNQVVSGAIRCERHSRKEALRIDAELKELFR